MGAASVYSTCEALSPSLSVILQFSDHIEDVSVSCSELLTVETKLVNMRLRWDFQVQTEVRDGCRCPAETPCHPCCCLTHCPLGQARAVPPLLPPLTCSSFLQRQLLHVALLKQEPGACFSLGEMSSDPCLYSSGACFSRGDSTYDIAVTFATANRGLYEQWLVLDFDMRPVLLKKLRVRTGKVELDENEEQAVGHGSALQRAEPWYRGNRDMVPCLPRTEDQVKLLEEYKRPRGIHHYTSSTFKSQPISCDNYRGRMHHFLFEEERAEDEVVSR